MAKSVILIGGQWGDEGKGKIVDLMTPHVAGVVRFQGGHNAGHTLVVSGKKTILRLLPSGVLRPHVRCFIGNGTVICPQTLCAEIHALEANGHAVSERLSVSNLANVLLPYHVQLDREREKRRKQKAIGTTNRGIGPAYEDKIARRGIRLIDLCNPSWLAHKLQALSDYHNFILKHYYGATPIPYETVLSNLQQLAPRITPLLADVSTQLATLHKQGKSLLFEGAQGTGLDIDHGTYPYVTASNTVSGYAAVGSGFGPLHFDAILGLFKAYTTRVGAGPFPTELKNTEGQKLAKRGHEFGSNTGRPRRCGWFDGVAARSAVQLNGLSHLCITKLDVLDAFETLKICTGYRLDDQTTRMPPASLEALQHAEPIYETLPGWQQNTQGITCWGDLPQAAQNYLKRIETLLETPLALISTGPQREQSIVIAPLF